MINTPSTSGSSLLFREPSCSFQIYKNHALSLALLPFFFLFMASFGESLGVGLRVGPARCTIRCNNKLITRRCLFTTQDRRPAWRPFERRRFILRSRPFITNAHRNNKSTSSFHTIINQHKILHNAIHKQNNHHHRASHYQSTSCLLSCLDSPPPANVDAVQAAKVNRDPPLDGAVEVDRDHLLCIQSIHNPLSYIVSHPSDHDETYGTGVLPLFEASMLSAPRRSRPSSLLPLHPQTSSSATPIPTPQAMISQSIARTSPAMGTSPTLIAPDGSSPHVLFDSQRSTQGSSDPRQCGRTSTTTTTTKHEAEIDHLADRFSALHISTPTTTLENRVANRINEGKWPWAARSTSTDFDVSTKRYEANLLMLLHDFVLKARHQYVLTKKWPAEEIERSALVLAEKARKAWAQGTREEIVNEEEGGGGGRGERNYLEELDWYWRYWGRRCRAEQKVWGYLVGGSAQRYYYAGATCVRALQQQEEEGECQRGVDF